MSKQKLRQWEREQMVKHDREVFFYRAKVALRVVVILVLIAVFLHALG